MDLKKQNILFFTRTMQLGGTENVILQLCKILKPHVNKIVVCSCGGVNEKILIDMGITHYSIPDMENKSIGNIYKIIQVLKKVIKDEDIRIVHTHHRMATFYARIINIFHKVTIISTLHGVFDDKRILTHLIYSRLPIIACGEVVKTKFVESFNINPSNIIVICNSVEKKEIEYTRIELISNLDISVKKIGYIGRISEEKGILLLIDAISKLVKKNLSFHLFIVGSGDTSFHHKVIKLIDKLQLNDYVSFLGYRTDIQNVIHNLDIIVLPSYTEGLPLTPIESFIEGKPVVATSAGGIVEIVENDYNGIIVPIGNSTSLAEGILKLCDDDEMYKKFSSNAVDTYESKFSYEVFQKKSS